MRIRLGLAAVLALVTLHCAGGGASAAPPADPVPTASSDGGSLPDATLPPGETTPPSGDATPPPGDDGPADAGPPAVMQHPAAVVDAGECPGLPTTGQWKNVTPPDAVDGGTSAIAVRPDYPSTIYAGTKNQGIYRSVDCGATWGLVSTGLTPAT